MKHFHLFLSNLEVVRSQAGSQRYCTHSHPQIINAINSQRHLYRFSIKRSTSSTSTSTLPLSTRITTETLAAYASRTAHAGHVVPISAVTLGRPQKLHQARANTSLSGTPYASTTNTSSTSSSSSSSEFSVSEVFAPALPQSWMSTRSSTRASR